MEHNVLELFKEHNLEIIDILHLSKLWVRNSLYTIYPKQYIIFSHYLGNKCLEYEHMGVNYMKPLYYVQIYVNIYFEQTNYIYGKIIKII